MAPIRNLIAARLARGGSSGFHSNKRSVGEPAVQEPRAGGASVCGIVPVLGSCGANEKKYRLKKEAS